MKPIPVAIHLGPLQFHTYGLGLAITFLIAIAYFGRRLRNHDLPDQWLAGMAVWGLVAAIIGARVVHVVANAPFYAGDPLQVFAIWNGGLSSFGGLLFGVPTGFFLAHRRAPSISLVALADLVSPVLLAAWAIGRLLGPQLMYQGGGHPTHQWFGMYYAGQIGRRLPVPVFQSLMTVVMLLIVWQVEAAIAHRRGPGGVTVALTVALWGTGRFIEEHFWLAYPGHPGAVAVQVAGLAMAVTGSVAAIALLVRFRRKSTLSVQPDEVIGV